MIVAQLRARVAWAAQVMKRAHWDYEREVWVLERLSDMGRREQPMSKRPVSASGQRRPVSDFAKLANAMGDMNPRCVHTRFWGVTQGCVSGVCSAVRMCACVHARTSVSWDAYTHRASASGAIHPRAALIAMGTFLDRPGLSKEVMVEQSLSREDSVAAAQAWGGAAALQVPQFWAERCEWWARCCAEEEGAKEDTPRDVALRAAWRA